MSTTAASGPRWRNSPFSRHSQSPSPSPLNSYPRPKSFVLASPQSSPNPAGHNRNQSFSSADKSHLLPTSPSRQRSDSVKGSNPTSNTFAPRFIKSAELQRGTENSREIEHENDFSGKRYVWLQDKSLAFTKGCVVEELEDGRLLVQCEDGSVSARLLVLVVLSMLTLKIATGG